MMRLTDEIEASKSFLYEQIFVVQKLLEEKYQSVGDSISESSWISEGRNQKSQSRKPNEDCHQ